MKRICSTLLAFWLCAAGHAYSEEVHLAPQTQGDVTYISGGVGEHERQAMRAIQGQYNLQLVFAVKGTGAYVAGSKVKIADVKGRTLLEAVSNGPDFFAKLKPGNYMVTAERNGHVLRDKVAVPAKHGTTCVFAFPPKPGE